MDNNIKKEDYIDANNEKELFLKLQEKYNQDYQSFYSKQKIIRPKISFLDIFLGLILPISIDSVLITIYCFHKYNLALFIILLIVNFILFLRPFLILSILLYQKFAPISLRRSCLFIPTCSEYTILAIKKYGAIVGLVKGTKRICRCHAPNGGEDWP